MPFTTHMIQPDMLLMRITSPVVSAMVPALTRPWLHNHSASADVPTINRPFMAVMVKSMPLIMRPDRRVLSVCSAMASRA